MTEEHTSVLKVIGTSMFPAMMPGCDVKIVSCKPEEIRRGDVICYPGGPNRMIIHRVIDIEDTADKLVFSVRGDNKPGVEKVEVDAIVGVACKVYGRLFSYSTSSTPGLFFTDYALSSKYVIKKMRSVAGYLFDSFYKRYEKVKTEE